MNLPALTDGDSPLGINFTSACLNRKDKRNAYPEKNIVLRVYWSVSKIISLG